MNIGFVGLGMMGRPMVERLLVAGHTVRVHNRSRAAVDELARRGARPAGSGAEVARQSEIVCTSLPTPESVQAVYADFATAAWADQVFVDHSTVSPELSRGCAQRLAVHGAGFLDAPVSGGPLGARAGTLTVMVGGDYATYTRTLPVLEAYGKNIRLCGPVGAGQVVKLVNQLLVGVHTAAIAEAAVFGAALGADPKVLLELIGTSFGGSTMMQRNVPRFIERDFSPATPVRIILKDLGVIHDVAKAAGAPLLLGALAEQRFLEASARGMGEQDMAAIVRLWEGAAGITVAPER
jgi:3-hydroxyisobutyrate dehydrogenase-like beta-hydroxyacid dehydrogenase